MKSPASKAFPKDIEAFPYSIYENFKPGYYCCSRIEYCAWVLANTYKNPRCIKNSWRKDETQSSCYDKLFSHEGDILSG